MLRFSTAENSGGFHAMVRRCSLWLRARYEMSRRSESKDSTHDRRIVRRRCEMNSFVRWMVLVFTMILSFPALAQTNQALPGGVTQFAGGMITHVQRTVLHDDIVHYRFDVK